MPGYDFRSPRLYVEAPLGEGASVPLDSAQAHYLGTVLRLKSGGRVLVFNGRDGEWSATLVLVKRTAALDVGAKTRAQSRAGGSALSVCAAQDGAARLYGAKSGRNGRLAAAAGAHPSWSGRAGQHQRMRANAVEAAEQCGILSLPDIEAPVPLARLLAERDAGRLLVFCDEDAEVANPAAALSGLPHSPLAVLIGPEGGFAEDERTALLRLPNVVRLSLGPRILRADTAAVAALTLVQTFVGDWG